MREHNNINSTYISTIKLAYKYIVYNSFDSCDLRQYYSYSCCKRQDHFIKRSKYFTGKLYGGSTGLLIRISMFAVLAIATDRTIAVTVPLRLVSIFLHFSIV